MSLHITFPEASRSPIANCGPKPSDHANARHAEGVGWPQAHEPTRRGARRATMPGPSRRITVEPLTVPAPSRPTPIPVPPEVEPTEEPRPDRDPVRAT
jgi:hypothetical protein